MKTEIELAKQAGWEYADDDRGFEPLWRFAELVRADEREACSGKVEVFARKWWSIHCGTNKHRDTTRKAHDDFCMLQTMIRARKTHDSD